MLNQRVSCCNLPPIISRDSFLVLEPGVCGSSSVIGCDKYVVDISAYKI